jgi:phosphate starvation-inducible PhoH-like protein
MSKKTRLRKRLADIDLDENEGEPVEYSSAPSKGFVIKNKYSLNEVHKTFLDLCLYEKTKMVFVDGPAGTAKTYLAVLAALNLLQQKKIKKIVYIRSIVESAEKSIGALPGELDEKFKPWSLPMLDKLHELLSDAATDVLLNNGTVQCIPVNFVRGLTFHDSVVIVDESQNLSRKELVSILTRFGHNSRFIIAGDLKQNDIAKSGYKEVLERFNDEESANNHIHCVHFGQNEIVRSHILKFIVRKLEC